MATRKPGMSRLKKKKKSSVPSLLQRPKPRKPIKPKYGAGKIGPPEKPGSKLGKFGKRLHRLAFETGTAFVNPPSVITDRLVGDDSPINANKLGGRVLNKVGLGILVPDKYKPKAKSPRTRPPERKPQKAKSSKTWRNRMNVRRNIN
jgi:hypothetical protein